MAVRVYKFTEYRKTRYISDRYRVYHDSTQEINCRFCEKEIKVGDLVATKPGRRLAKLYHLGCAKFCHVLV